MPTLDDAPDFASGVDAMHGVNTPVPEFGFEVHAMLTASAQSPRKRMQVLGVKAQAALDALASALKRETAIAAAEAELARLRRGGE